MTGRMMVMWIGLLALGAESTSPVVPQFRDVAERASLSVRLVSGNPHTKPYLVESVGGGLAVIDFNNDGWLDLYIPNGTTIERARAGEPGANGALYRNNGDGTFTDVTAESGIRTPHWGKGALAADFNNDGFQDLYITSFGPNLLYLNNGDGTFRDETARAGVGDPRWSSAAAAADFDKDGHLDLFVANYVEYDLHHLPTEGKFCSYHGLKVACGPRGLQGAGNRLYRNNGDGTFTDVSEAAGITGKEGFYALGAVWGDLDNDGHVDLVVANDTTPNDLFRNNGDGTFTNIAVESGIAFSEDGREQAGMGVELEDLDNDGLLDLMITNFSDDYNTLYRNLGDGYFQDDSHQAGLVADSWRDLSWGVGFFDFNNDGLKDIFVANGHIYPQVDGSALNLSYKQTNKLYLNTGARRFKNVTAQAGPGLREKRSFRGAAFADFNNDGRIDIVLSALDDAPTLLLNEGSMDHHWILVRLTGTQSNRFGVGARVSVRTSGVTQLREVKAGGSFASTNDPRAHFGLASHSSIDELTVDWPSGNRSVLRKVKANQILTIRE
ncbi:MAG: CRTAC1 family protein [Bryobacterales bacterium]|nr:CRTAC1 family protein [Bryobacterales bacterium]